MSDIDINEIIEILQSPNNQITLKNAIICELHKLTTDGPNKKDLYLIADNTLTKANQSFTQLLNDSNVDFTMKENNSIPNIKNTENNKLINELFKDTNFFDKLKKNIERKLSNIEFNFVNTRTYHIGGDSHQSLKIITMNIFNGTNSYYMQGINTAIQKNPDFIFLQEAINEINVDNYTYDVKGSGSERMGILSKTGNTWEMTSSEIINTNNADSDSNKCNTQRDEIIYTITHTSDNTNIKIANVHLCGGGPDERTYGISESKNPNKLTSIKIEPLKRVINRDVDIVLGDFNSDLGYYLNYKNDNNTTLPAQQKIFLKELGWDDNMITAWNIAPFVFLTDHGFELARLNDSNGILSKTSQKGNNTPDAIWYKKSKVTLKNNTIALIDLLTTGASDHNGIYAEFNVKSEVAPTAATTAAAAKATPSPTTAADAKATAEVNSTTIQWDDSSFKDNLVDRIVKGLDRKPIQIELKVNVDGVDCKNDSDNTDDSDNDDDGDDETEKTDDETDDEDDEEAAATAAPTAAAQATAAPTAAAQAKAAAKIKLVIGFANEIIKHTNVVETQRGSEGGGLSKYDYMDNLIIVNRNYKNSLKNYINTDWCKSENDPIWDKVIDYVYSDTNTDTDNFFENLSKKFIKPMRHIDKKIKHINQTYLFYRILLAKWRVDNKSYTQNTKNLPYYLNKYHEQCSKTVIDSILSNLKAVNTIISLINSTRIKLKKTLKLNIKTLLEDQIKKNIDILKSQMKITHALIDLSPIYQNKFQDNETIIEAKSIIASSTTIDESTIKKLQKDTDNLVANLPAAPKGGSKKKRTVTIKSNAMPKTVKGLQTKKKLLKKKIKKAEKKVKLSKDRIIKLK